MKATTKKKLNEKLASCPLTSLIENSKIPSLSNGAHIVRKPFESPVSKLLSPRNSPQWIVLEIFECYCEMHKSKRLCLL